MISSIISYVGSYFRTAKVDVIKQLSERAKNNGIENGFVWEGAFQFLPPVCIIKLQSVCCFFFSLSRSFKFTEEDCISGDYTIYTTPSDLIITSNLRIKGNIINSHQHNESSLILGFRQSQNFALLSFSSKKSNSSISMSLVELDLNLETCCYYFRGSQINNDLKSNYVEGIQNHLSDLRFIDQDYNSEVPKGPKLKIKPITGTWTFALVCDHIWIELEADEGNINEVYYNGCRYNSQGIVRMATTLIGENSLIIIGGYIEMQNQKTVFCGIVSLKNERELVGECVQQTLDFIDDEKDPTIRFTGSGLFKAKRT